jgi:hypothetical protein
MERTDMIAAIHAVDRLFLRMVEAEGRLLPSRSRDEAVEDMWTQLEFGDLCLIIEDDRLRVAPFDGVRGERLRLARKVRPLIAARRQSARSARKF